MRVAILVLGIIGSLLAISLAACAGAAAGIMGDTGALAEEAVAEIAKENDTEITETDQAEFDEGMQALGDATGVVGNVALAAGAQGILGLIGCIVAFVALGKGNKAIIGGALLLLAVVASLWAGDFPSIGVSNILHLIAAIMAFVAVPNLAAAE